MDPKINIILKLLKQKKLEEAKKKCLEIIQKYKKNPEFLNILAIIYFQLNDYKRSVDYWKEAAKLNPSYYDAHNNLANALLKLKQYQEALTSFEKALRIKPESYDVCNNIGNVKSKLGELNQALLSYEKSIEIKPENILAHIFKGHILSELERYEEALISYNNAYLINPQQPLLLGYILHTKSKICNWENYDKDVQELALSLKKRKKTSYPFTTLVVFDSPHLQKISSEIWSEQYVNIQTEKKFLHPKNKKIRIGYFSADFRDHATSHLISQIFELHDKTKFELYGFYLGRKIKTKDIWHERVKNSLNEFIEVEKMTDLEISNLSRSKRIDIAIDLMAHCGNGMENRFGAFVLGCAPLQINFLGYPGTSGSKSMNYIIADKIVIPKDQQENYSEKIIYMPDVYQPNLKKTKISDKNFFKKDFNLPNDKFIFCCFNQHQKITPNLFDIWMKILEKNSNSVLWLIDDNSASNKNLVFEANKRKIDEKRLIFAKRLPLDEHLKRIQLADLFLDTFPYSAHTTCSDSLRVGLPVLTMIGSSFASRVASSLLKSINLDELVVKSLKEYEDLANKIYEDQSYLYKLKNKINKNITTSALYDSELFTKNLEDAYNRIYHKFFNENKIENLEL